ncbi:MAG TPA: PQQ-binding-like beta-propeller repeat protein [Terriglobia bacterium]|nr:PQQ-binding-like beta-propeller repeat protein [Terriglobia bacterium]
MKLSVLLMFVLVTVPMKAQVTFDRILHSKQEPENWLTYGGTYANDRYSLLTQIHRNNVKNLQLKWVWRPTTTPADEKMECTPIVVNGVLYATSLTSVVALDAATGRQYWKFTRSFNPDDFPGQRMYMVNKGVAIEGNTLFWTTGWDDHLLAIDARTGHLKWEVKVDDWNKGYQLNMPPLVVKNELIVGPATDDMGANCFIAAFNIHTGKLIWKTYTSPNSADDPAAKTWAGNTWKHGGVPVWNNGSYDPETNLVFYGTGNPNPVSNGDQRSPGSKFDNLYADCVIAFDADTGKIRWYFQFTPGDEYDYDATQIPVLADINWHGEQRKVMLWANRNGFFYVLDRETGKFLMGKAFTKLTWAKGLDKNGRPIRDPKHWPKPMGGTLVWPGSQGGTNYYPPSYDPQTGLFYVSTWQNYEGFSDKRPILPWKQMHMYTGDGWWPGFGQSSPPANWPPPSPRPRAPGVSMRGNAEYKTLAEGYGAILALDPQTGEKKWEFKMVNYTECGVLSTAGGVVFGGGKDGIFVALDAETGTPLWHVNVGDTANGMGSGPMTYAVNGKQYIVTTAADTMYAFALPD